jgi:hypothetical protein
MMKRLMGLMGALALLSGLVACRASTTPTSQVATATASPAPKATPTATGRPAATATPVWQIPRIQDSDWVMGSPDAGLTIVEYSDLQ